MESNTQENATREPYPAPQGISGLGGWLVLVQIVLYSTFILLLLSAPAYFILITEVWEGMTSEESIHYHVLWGPMVVIHLVYMALLILLTGYILIQFYRKKAMVPRLMIIFYIAPVVFGIINLILLYQIPLALELDEGESLKAVVRDTLTCAIFIPYFIKSKRVRNTFVR
ncbi:hypothetical protein PAECIP111893_03452 [Paenibacillus plantiphilus]|uniref:DUF2569 domain-containing protein n=1 Tax=Paenibacillus plantiphilus TaxID=2905650 RepID=A0ABM9CEC8_9BACL|nr:DUF2569 domain-containing protein [Paenibacillus plantiphilus]CAH1211663.1 hypothetical protein PAECIP111893_03452 [Paenibacillus plantiphilus]